MHDSRKSVKAKQRVADIPPLDWNMHLELMICRASEVTPSSRAGTSRLVDGYMRRRGGVEDISKNLLVAASSIT